MNASEAFKISQENWAANEQEYLKSIVGFQQKVGLAAKEGRTSCVIGTIPVNQISFTSAMFEQLGYYVGWSNTPTGEALLTLDWKNEPFMSRPYQEAKTMNKMLE